ncbi:HIT domain-containing protein [Sphingomonas sp.]|uniref:HIT domain-containing protein n=1 Tax=Sphingomonas sp. TaxID=28214 RepID=UPI00286D1598|nr:HIT domain-containing protein [Sphingomonas sp.]
MPIDSSLPYDAANIFARILRGELPCKTVLETEHSLAFHDINPLAPIHVLVIPRGAYVSWDDFSAKASDPEIADFVRAVGEVARMTRASAQGYRLLANTGKRGGQEVAHLHVHVFGGAPLGPMLAK